MDINLFNNLINNPTNQFIFLLLTICSLIWKGIALWKSSQNKNKKWFIAILIINSFGILEIIYLFYFNQKGINETDENN